MIVFNVALKCYFLKGSEINLRVAKDKSQTMYLRHIRKLTQMSGLLWKTTLQFSVPDNIFDQGVLLI